MAKMMVKFVALSWLYVDKKIQLEEDIWINKYGIQSFQVSPMCADNTRIDMENGDMYFVKESVVDVEKRLS